MRVLFLLLCAALFPLPAQIAPAPERGGKGVEWGSVLRQSALFLGIQHSYRLAMEPGTRAELKGPFVKDWLHSAVKVRGWGDKDPFIVNYVGHPMMGGVSSWIFTQNHPIEKRLTFTNARPYWVSRLKGMAWSAVYSAQFELGPWSEASIGNLGYKVPGTAGAVDLVVTPVAGLGIQVAEDFLDHYLVEKLEKRIPWRAGKVLVRGVFNPTRSFANTLRGKAPWHRDTRPGSLR